MIIKKTDITRTFSTVANSYDRFAFIEQTIGHRLLDRLQALKTVPRSILDIGSGTGFFTRKLQNQFTHSQVFGVDIAQGMINFAKKQQRWQWSSKPIYICADLEQLPFPNAHFDLLFSNLTLPWCFDLPHAFQEFKRVLKPDGHLFFTTLGQQTLPELQQSWASFDPTSQIGPFIDLQSLGDLLLKAGFSGPVVDLEPLTFNYANIAQLLRDLKATGASLLYRHSLTSNLSEQLLQSYESFKTPAGYPVTIEILYGYAFKNTSLTYPMQEGVVQIPDIIPVLDH